MYIKYLRNAGGLFWAPVIGTLLAVGEAGNGECFSLEILFEFAGGIHSVC